jgi:hypothetical protein
MGLMPIPKNFAILTKPRIEVDRVDEKKYNLDFLMNFPGAWKALNEKWLETPRRLIDGEIQLLSDFTDYRHFVISINYTRKGIAAKEYREEKAEFEVWQHKNGFSLVVNAPRELAELTATFLSVAVYKDPFAVRIRKLSQEDFFTLLQYVRGIGGRVIVLQLRYVKTVDMGELSVLKISGETIEGESIEKLLNAARKITRIGFQIPTLNGERFKFWVGHWGGGTIYSPTMSKPHHAWSLIKFFEEALKE